MPRSRTLASVLLVIVATGLLGTSAFAAPADGGQVTSGAFHNLAAGTTRGFHLSGRAQMVRTGASTTKASVHIAGLRAGSTYAVHVHNAACNVGDAGGHYMYASAVSGGKGSGHNEIWPGPVKATGNGVANGNTSVGGRAGANAMSVVVHDTDGTKIGCADLT